jgi:predicted ATPase
VALLEHRDRVVGKDELLALAWPGLVVEENNLTVQVSALRKALGPAAIATVAGRGYRFALPVEGAATAAPQAGPPVPASPPAESGPPDNLPAARSSFIGREQETAAVRQRLGAQRLVTLTGIGGSGKTRLALQVGQLELAAAPCRFPDGVFFVDLGPVADPDLVAPTLAAACGLAPGDTPAGLSRSFAQRLASALAPRRALLLVDNCEHLLDATAELADTLLAGCPHLVLLATSREALGLEGEQVIQVASLAVPDASAPDAVTDAMRLFADRAQAAQANFHLDAQTRPAVAEICRRLDGIPLAIEFAAARISHLSPAQVAERLGDRFRLLTGGRRRIARQQTLAAALDWSHDLLGGPEQGLFRRLAVFAGGFRLAAAEAVGVDDAADRRAVLDRLGSLVAQSLVMVDQDKRAAARETRYRLLETVRLYALDRLEAAGETARLRSRHRDHHLAWLEALPLEQLLFDNDALRDVGGEIDNLRAAVEWCLAEDRPDLLVRLVTRMAGYWFAGNAYRFAQELLERALQDEARLSVQERVAAHAVLAWLSILALDLRSAAWHGERGTVLAAGRLHGFALAALTLRAFALSGLSTWPGADPDLLAQARADARLSVETARAGRPAIWQPHTAHFAALVELHGGAFEAAAESASKAGVHSSYHLASLSGLAVVRLLAGQFEAARDAALRCLGLLETSGSEGPLIEGWIVEVVPALVAGGESELAERQLRRSARTMRRNGVDLAPNHFLGVAGVVELLRGRPDRAARLLGAARGVGVIEEGAVRFRTPTALAMYLQCMPRLRAASGPRRRARPATRAAR